MPKQRQGADNQSKCDFCNQSKGRNAKIVHQLKFESPESLRSHLLTVSSKEDYESGWIDSEIKWFNFVHRYYSLESRKKFEPLWLTYLRALGTPIKNAVSAIRQHRNQQGQQEVPF